MSTTFTFLRQGAQASVPGSCFLRLGNQEDRPTQDDSAERNNQAPRPTL